jgi:hypothetical protein
MRLHDDPECPIELIASRLGFDAEEVRAMLSWSVQNQGRHENGEPNEGRVADSIETNGLGHLKKSPVIASETFSGCPRAAIEGAILELSFKRRRVQRFVGDHFRRGQFVIIGGRFQGGRSSIPQYLSEH